MNRNVIIGIFIAIMVVIIGIVGYVLYNQKNKGNKSNNVINENIGNDNAELPNNTNGANQEKSGNSKILVAYYSAQKHTKAVAEKIAKNLNADLFEIVPEEIYSSADLNWSNSNSRVSREHNDESLRNIKLKEAKVPDFEKYDTVLIGYPIWWAIAAWPVDTFVKSNDFNGKTVIPFCTSVSSSLGQSGKLLEKQANGGNWKDGYRFRENPSDADINRFIRNIK